MSSMNLLSEVNGWLPEVNRLVGVLIAVVGAVVVAPSGTRLLLEWSWGWVRRRGQQIQDQLARVFPALRRNLTITAEPAGLAVAVATGWGSATVSRPWDPSAPVDERIEALRQHILEIEESLTGVGQQLSQQTAASEGADAELDERLRAEGDELRRRLDEQERQSARIDARGLPVIAAGIFLSGVPDELASIPLGFGWPFPVLGIGLALAAAIPARREAHARQSIHPLPPGS